VSDRIEGLKRVTRKVINAKVIVLGLLAASGYTIYKHPPLESIARREVGIRLNRVTGSTTQVNEGVALMIPGIHDLRRYSLQDQLYRPERSIKANGEAPFQSSEGLSLGVELTIRYALDPDKLATVANKLPADLDGELVEPLVQGVIYKVFTRYTVREIFSTKRQELQDVIESELKPLLANDGIILRSVMMGNVDLPADYRAGMDKLLAVELETEQMQYTLQLKEKQVKESELAAEADKVRREKAAEATANEQIIAAKAQEEAMKHVLPFKQKQIEQRQLEAEAEKASRIKTAEGTAEARRIEASGEADSRRKLADAETYRLDQLGKVNSEQMERDGALISKHPLLIQKTMADKLSDKISVIIAPPPAAGGFIGTALMGATQPHQAKTTVASNDDGDQQ
jgi:regulator of protease activity HflC (stomatin/prohibitin superfamily)